VYCRAVAVCDLFVYVCVIHFFINSNSWIQFLKIFQLFLFSLYILYIYERENSYGGNRSVTGA